MQYFLKFYSQSTVINNVPAVLASPEGTPMWALSGLWPGLWPASQVYRPRDQPVGIINRPLIMINSLMHMYNVPYR